MDFITWLFEKHDVLSTVFFPLITLAWCIFKGEVLRGIACVFLLFLKLVGNDKK
jgi:hypothetical protein